MSGIRDADENDETTERISNALCTVTELATTRQLLFHGFGYDGMYPGNQSDFLYLDGTVSLGRIDEIQNELISAS